MFTFYSHLLSFRCLTLCLFTGMFLAGMTAVHAQYGQTATDGHTPPDLERGAPAGSFALSGFETINPYNGNLSVVLPLLQGNGRGGSGSGMRVKVDRHIGIYREVMSNTPYSYVYGDNITWSGNNIDRVGYGPGVLIGKNANNNPYTDSLDCQQNGSSYPESNYNTRLYFTTPDGSEIQLHDKKYNGSIFIRHPCAYSTPMRNRGKVFVSDDGESITFISDNDITDFGQNVPNNEFFPSGYLLMSDGTRYRMDGGKVSWIRDRNGNQTTFAYENTSSWRIVSAKDSLNRQVTISYNDTLGAYDEISYKGFGGASRSIKIWHQAMHSALRPDYTIKKANQLFPEVYIISNSWTGNWDFDMPVVSKVDLPDGRSYQFYYNSYGEIARIILPTGGGMDYTHGTADPASSGSYGGAVNTTVLRRVMQRTTYSALTPTALPANTASGNVERIEKFIKEGTWSAAPTIVRLETRAPDSANTLLTQSKVYYNGTGVDSLTSTAGPADFDSWTASKEYKNETYNVVNGLAGSVLRATDTTWGPNTSCNCPAPNPHIDQIVATLADTNQVSKQTFSYDQYNNKTDSYEYDYGAGAAPSTPIRRTHTDYLTSSGYDTVVGGITAPDAASSIHIRNLPTQEIVYDGNVIKSRTVFEYDNYTNTPPHAALVNRTNITALVSRTGATQALGYNATADTMRGNATAITRYSNAAASTGAITSYVQYDIAGNVVKTIDGNNNATTFDFTDRFGAPNGEAQSNTNPSELSAVGQATYAFPTKVTNAKGHTAYTQLDYYLGKPVDTEDPNNSKSSVEYNDPLDRPTQGRRNSTTATAYYAQTTIAYDDTNRVITVSSDKATKDDNALVSKATYDGLGRTRRTATYENADTAKPWIITETQFDGLGRAYRTTNPWRGTTITATLPGTPEWTTSTFDALGRVTTVSAPDASVVQTQYNGNVVTVIDQAKKVRRSITDGLGRLTRVDEPTRDFTTTEANQSPLNPDLLLGSVSSPNQATSYTYDVLDNLLTVNQGAQTRTFVYDSLKRLASATLPESGTTTYSYDNNGNLKQKTDALGRWMQYNYDELNRNYESFSNDSQTVSTLHVYDGAVNGKGKLWYTMTNSGYSGGPAGQYLDNTTYESYDALGRLTSYRQNFRINNDTAWSSNYATTRTYDLAGNVLSQTYPSGRTVNYAYNTANQMTSFTGNLGGGTPRDYATEMAYNPRGQMVREKFAMTTPLYHRMYYNKRGQMFDARLGTDGSTAYDVENPAVWRWATGTWNRGAIRLYYSSTENDYDDYTSSLGALTNNNGNVYRMEHFVPGNDNVTSYTMSTDKYTYDALNRLLSVKERQNNNGAESDAFQQANLYDRYGNRTIDPLNTWAKDGSVWSEDSVPTGATAVADTDGWNWVTANPTAFSGSSSHQSANLAGVHQHYFYGATTTLTPASGESLYAWVYLDPTSPPTEVMLQWNNGDWEHRAYWGANQIGWGVDGTNSRRYMGALPATGGWVRLEVPASQVGLVGSAINGMAFSLYGGKATWDRAGKTGVAGGGINNTQYTVNTANNRLQPTGNCSTMTYDAVGNLTNDCGKTRSYDANNKMRGAVDGAVTTGYRYDADGRRTLKSVGSTLTWYIYGMGGELIAEYPANTAPSTPQIEYGYRGSELLIEGGCDAVRWRATDQLGSTRMTVGTSGALTDVKRTDYLPFGEESGAGVGIRATTQGYSQTDCFRQKFTGYEKDTETGLDYAQARYYANGQGRFMSVDKVYFQAKMLVDPQSFNLYSYARNNPLKFIDPNGEAIEVYGTEEERKTALEELRKIVGSEAGKYLYLKTDTDSKGNILKDKDGNTRYFIGILGGGPSGKEPNFENVNNVAGELAPIINDTKILGLQVFNAYSKDVNFDEGKKALGSPEDGMSPAFTGHVNGQLTIYALNSDYIKGSIPANLMEDNKPGYIYPGEPLGHEIGHGRDDMTGRERNLNGQDAGSIRLENKIRKLNNPAAPNRQKER